MPMIGIRDLSRRLSRYLETVEESGRPLIVTRHGRPVAAVIKITEDELDDFILSRAPEFTESLREADRDLAAGETSSLREIVADLEADVASNEEAAGRDQGSRRATRC